MTAYQKIFLFLEVQLVEDVGLSDFVHVAGQHLVHRRTCDVDMAVFQAFCKQMTAGVFRVDQIEIGNMVDDPAVDFFRDIEVKRTVACFHVVNRNLHAFRHNSGNGGIGVAEN